MFMYRIVLYFSHNTAVLSFYIDVVLTFFYWHRCTQKTNKSNHGRFYLIAVTNLALNKPTWQHSTKYGGVASRAVDGNPNPHYGDGSCTHTYRHTYPTWGVDLLTIANVYDVEIMRRDFNRHGMCLHDHVCTIACPCVSNSHISRLTVFTWSSINQHHNSGVYMAMKNVYVYSPAPYAPFSVIFFHDLYALGEIWSFPQ